MIPSNPVIALILPLLPRRCHADSATRILSITSALVLLLALPVAPAVAQQKEVVVAVLYPLSGPTASAGLDGERVYELFADMVNGKEPMIPGAFTSSSRACPGSRAGPGSASSSSTIRASPISARPRRSA